jgi:hypothetical protein
MPFIRRLCERIRNSGAHADQRGLFDAELGRYLVRSAESDAADGAPTSPPGDRSVFLI